jgi:hypothetical protein
MWLAFLLLTMNINRSENVSHIVHNNILTAILRIKNK